MAIISGYHPLLNPKPELPLWLQCAIDGLTWTLPVVAALCSVGAGAAALCDANTVASVLGIAGGVTGALGVIFTNWASRIRDDRLAYAQRLAQLGVNMGNSALEQMPPHF